MNVSGSGLSFTQRTKWGSFGTRGFSLRTGIRGLSYRSRYTKKDGDFIGVVVLLGAILIPFACTVVYAVLLVVAIVLKFLLLVLWEVVKWCALTLWDFSKYCLEQRGLRRGLLRDKDASLAKLSREPGTSGQLIAELTDSVNLVDGRQTWELAEAKKHDIEYMKRCCDAELKTMEAAGLIAAPYYFDRVAVLSRKAKAYRQEVYYCELYIRLVENYYAEHGTEGATDVRKGRTFQGLVVRLPKARELLAKSEQGT